MAQITGRVKIWVNSDLMLNKAGAVASGVGISGQPNFEVEPIMGDTGFHGSVEKPIMAELTVDLTDRSDVSLSDLAKILENGTVIFEDANGGKSYTLNQATCARNISVTAGEGTTPIKFFGPYWTEA